MVSGAWSAAEPPFPDLGGSGRHFAEVSWPWLADGGCPLTGPQGTRPRKVVARKSWMAGKGRGRERCCPRSPQLLGSAPIIRPLSGQRRASRDRAGAPESGILNGRAAEDGRPALGLLTLITLLDVDQNVV